jgi:putative ABC transport system permease protein
MGGAISLVARSLLRRRWAGLVLIGLIAAITGAAVAGAATVARRTATAYPRLEAASGLGDAIAIVDGGPEVTEALLELPQVAAARPGTFLIGEDADEPYSYMGITVPVTDSPVVTPVITRGRAPDPSDPSHIVIPEWLADLAGIGPGTTFEFDLLSPVQYGEFPQQRPPDGPRISLEIVGVGRLAGLPEVLPPFHGTPALAAAHAEWQISDVLSVDLVDPAATGDFAAAVADLDRRSERIEGREEFTAVSASPVAQHRVSVGSSSRLLTGGLVAFVVAVVLAGTVALGQSLARLFGLDARDQQTEAALGLRPGARLAARLVIVAVPALLGAAGALAGGLLGARIEPLGSIRGLEPAPGPAVNVAIVASVVAGTVVVVVAAGALAVVRSGRLATTAPLGRPSAMVRRLATLGTGPVGITGIRFALEPGRGPRAVPTRTAIAGVVGGVIGLTALLVTVSSADRLVDDPVRWGAGYDLRLETDRTEAEEIAAMDGVASVSADRAAPVLIDGELTTSSAMVHVQGAVTWTLFDGRGPERSGEVVLGSRIAGRVGAGVGDTVHITDRAGDIHRMAVVGVGVGPQNGSDQLGSWVQLWPADQEEVALAEAFGLTLIDVADGADVDALAAELRQGHELSERISPPEVADLAELDLVPVLLGVILAGLAALALANALLVAVRRRRGDVGILRTLGFVPRQAGGTLFVMATSTAIGGVVLGVPLGLALGATLWRDLARRIGVQGDPSMPWSALVVLALAVPLLALAVSAVPAARAARLRPAEVLRTE